MFYFVGLKFNIWGTGQNKLTKSPPNNEIIIQSYYNCFILIVILLLKDILKGYCLPQS